MPNSENILLTWHVHPSVILGLLLFQGLYLLGVGPLRQRIRWAEQIETHQLVLFSLAVLVIFIALDSPLHDLSDSYLFSAHMLQHLLLMLVMPPLLLLGTPGWLLRPLLNVYPLWRVARLLTFPIVAFLLPNAILAFWHMPSFYDLALRHHNTHILQHLTVMLGGVLLWWPLFSPLLDLPRLPQPGQLLYLFAQSVPMGFLGAFITFSNTLVYTFYAQAPRIWNISPITDQQLGGLLMKSAGGLVLFAALSIVFFRWFSREEAEGMEAKK